MGINKILSKPLYLYFVQMTERTGGSDVGNTETTAKKNKDGTYSISGYKFFTSASTSDASILLARVADENGNTQKVIA